MRNKHVLHMVQAALIAAMYVVLTWVANLLRLANGVKVTIFTCGTFETYEKKTGKKLHQMNPSYYDLKALLEVQECLNKVR